MKTGFSKVCITPPMGVPISGYFEERYTKGVLDDIFARAVAFVDGERKAVIVAVDQCELGQYYFDAIKSGIMNKMDIDKDAIFINCSHTHTGPAVGEKNSIKEYDDWFIEKVAEAAVSAFSDLKETKMSVARNEAKGISFVRRFRMKNGYVTTNPGVNNPEIDCALGKPNETVYLLKLERENADDIFIINFGTHADTIGGEYISADYPGFVCSILERAVPGTKCMFLLGCEGDTNHINVNPTKAQSRISNIDFDGVPRSYEHSEYMGRVIAGAILSVCSLTEPVKYDRISYGSKTVKIPSNQENDRLEEAKKINDLYVAGRSGELPFEEMELTIAVAEAQRIVELEDGPEFFDFSVSAIKIGDFVFAGMGGEVFTEIGNRVMKKTPYKETMLCCLTNSSAGYIPNKEAYDEGGYETRSSRFKKGADDIIVDAMIKLLKEI